MKNILDSLIQNGLSGEAEKLDVLEASQKASSFKIPVMGGIKSGKSTLLARMFGVQDSFFPRDTVEATAKSVNVSYGPFVMRTYTSPEEEEISVSDDMLWSQMVCGQSDILFTKLEVQLPDSLLDYGALTFVDTPGNNTCDDYKATETWNALVDSQAGIYCLKATALMEQSDLVFLQEAKYYLNDFIFLITRIDEAGGKSVNSDISNQLVFAAKKKLDEFDIHPLAVLPISALASNLDDSGIPALRAFIKKTIMEQETVLRNHQVFRQGTRILETAKKDLLNAMEIAKKASTMTKEQFNEQKGILQSKLIDLNAEMDNSLRRMEKKIDSLKINCNKKINQFSDAAVSRIETRLSEMKDYVQIKESGDSIVRSEIDKWRQDVQAYLTQLPNEISDMQVESSQEFIAQLHDSVLSTMDLNLQLQIADDDEDLSAKTYADEYLEKISNQKEELVKNIDSIQHEIENSGDRMPELERKLAEAKACVQALHYEPVYDQVERQKTGGVTPFLKTVGNIADIAMIFLPTGWITGIGKAGVAGSKLPKIAKIVKTGSAMSGVSKVIANTQSQNKDHVNPLEILSLEFWGEKLGNMIDGPNSNEPIFDMVENQEVLGDYLKKRNELEAICNQALLDYSRYESIWNEKQMMLDSLKQQDMELSSEYKKAEEEVRDIKKEMKDSSEKNELAKWKKNVLIRINNLFYSSQSELIGPIVTALDIYFKDCSIKSKQQLQSRLSATIKQIEEQLSGNDLAYSQEESASEKNLSIIANKIKCIEDILNLPKELWFAV